MEEDQKQPKTEESEREETQVQKPAIEVDTSEEENSFDFGGLPSRDLKKNIGCGG